MKQLSDTQIHALCELEDSGLTHFGAMIAVGRSYRRTLDVLINRGLVRYHPYGDHGRGSYAITRDGRTVLTRFAKKASGE